MDNRELAIKLATTEKEEDIVELLKDLKYWSNHKCWHPFGDNENNFSIIGNQQSKADAALVEKLINSVDAILIKECLIRGIDPQGQKSPQTMTEALHRFFNIIDGQISTLDVSQRNQMSKNIILAATGNKFHINFIIADKGEGQTPNRMPSTILSIGKNNKLRVPFVQGKFNMGGTGVLPFCGENRFQLVISKRCPSIPNTEKDESYEDWSMTIIRREDARDGRRSSMYTYLTDEKGKMLQFKAKNLPIIPTPNSGKPELLDYGTFFKLYNYDLTGYKSNILFDFNYRMSMLMPELGHPIRLRECRNYNGHSFETTLSGLTTRLNDDRSQNLENGFPFSETFIIEEQTIRCSVYAFKAEKSQNYREKEGILFTVNGQTHATIPQSFFNRAKLSYLADSLLVIVDCSSIDNMHREDMFMNSRDRLRDNNFVKEIKNTLKSILGNHPGLKKLQNERRNEKVRQKLNDDIPMKNVLSHILSQSPLLSKILIEGAQIQAPFDMKKNVGNGNEFKGEKHPTFFTLKENKTGSNLLKKVPINRDFRIQFETDVENNYWSRTDERGDLLLWIDDIPSSQLIKHKSLFNGVATITMSLPNHAESGNILTYKLQIKDDYITKFLQNSFQVKVLPSKEENSPSTHSSTRPSPRGDKDTGRRKQPTMLSMPNMIPFTRDEWDKHKADKETALIIMTNDDVSDYYINMDNHYLLSELKTYKNNEEMELAKAQYKYSMTLIGMSIESYYKTHPKNDKEDVPADVPAAIKEITAMLAPILIPMIKSMSELDTDQITT